MGSTFCPTMTVGSRILGTAASTSAGLHRSAHLATRPAVSTRDSKPVSLASQFTRTGFMQVPIHLYAIIQLKLSVYNTCFVGYIEYFPVVQCQLALSALENSATELSTLQVDDAAN